MKTATHDLILKLHGIDPVEPCHGPVVGIGSAWALGCGPPRSRHSLVRELVSRCERCGAFFFLRPDQREVRGRFYTRPAYECTAYRPRRGGA